MALDIPSVAEIPPSLPGKFPRMALVAACGQIEALGPVRADTLVVSSDWLAWREAADRGWLALHVEAGLGQEGAYDPGQPYMDAAAWPYVDGIDATLFKGVSVGRQFIREVGHACHYYGRLRHALAGLLRQFQVSEVELIDIRADYGLLDEQSRRQLVKDAVEEAGAILIDRLGEFPAGPDALSTTVMVTVTPGKPSGLRAAWGRLVDWGSRLRHGLGRRKPKILILPSLMMLRPLIEGFRDPGRVTPVVLADRYPKRPAFALECWRKGLFLSDFPVHGLSTAETAEVDAMADRLRSAWRSEARGVEAFSRRYVVEILIGSGRFHAMAARIKQWDILFRRHDFRLVMATDATNYESRIPFELAKRHGVPRVELVNGVFNTSARFDARCGDRFGSPLISRFLAWGAQQTGWLDEIEANIPVREVGYPVLEPLWTRATGTGQGSNALVLATPPAPDDLTARRGDAFTISLKVLELLASQGYTRLKFKLHPGLENASYYAEAFRRFGIEAEILKSEPLHPLIRWADVVVGPVTSGAMVEAWAMGKPYFPVLWGASSVTMASRADLPLADGVETLRRFLDLPFDRDRPLNRMCGALPGAVAATWAALLETMEEGLTCP